MTTTNASGRLGMGILWISAMIGLGLAIALLAIILRLEAPPHIVTVVAGEVVVLWVVVVYCGIALRLRWWGWCDVCLIVLSMTAVVLSLLLRWGF